MPATLMSQGVSLLRGWHLSFFSKSNRARQTSMLWLGCQGPGPCRIPSGHPCCLPVKSLKSVPMPALAWLCVQDPMTTPALTFSGIYAITLDFDHCLSSSYKVKWLARFPRRQGFQDFNPFSKHFSQMLLRLSVSVDK